MQKHILLIFLLSLILSYFFIGRQEDANIKFKAKENFYLSYTERDDIDHSYFFHNTNNIIKSVRESEILTIGNSKMLFALDHNLIERYNFKSEYKIFNFSFNYGEGVKFPIAIIEKYKLKPKFLIVHVGPYMFLPIQISEPAKIALSNNRWYGIRRFIEFNLNTTSQDLLHKFISNSQIWNSLYIRIYRSKVNGCIDYRTSSINKYKFNWSLVEQDTINEHIIDGIRKLNSFCQLNNIGLILTQVPSPEINPFILTELSKQTGIKFIHTPRTKTFSTFDNSHLDRNSSKVFTEEFLRSLNLEITPSI